MFNARARAGLAVLLGGLLLLIAPVAASAATRTFDGGAGTADWNTAQNWSADTLPGAADDVVIPTAKAVTLDAGAAGAARTLEIDGTGTLLVSGRALTVSSGAGAPASTLSGSGTQIALAAGGSLSLAGQTNWTSGGIDLGALGSNTLTVPSGGTLSITAGLTLSGGASSTFHIAAGGKLLSDTVFGIVSIDAPIDNDGTIGMTSGISSELRLLKGTTGTSSGAFQTQQGSTLVFGGAGATYELGAGASIAKDPLLVLGGDVRLEGAVVHVGPAATFAGDNTIFKGGTLRLDSTAVATSKTITSTSGFGGTRDGSATLNVTQAAILEGIHLGGGVTNTKGTEILGGFTIDGGAVLNIAGVASWQTGNITAGGAGTGTINVAANGYLQVYSTGTATNAGGGLLHVLANGALDNSAASGTIKLLLPVQNEGDVTVGAFTLQVSSLTQNAPGDTYLDYNRTLKGPVTLNGGTLDGAGIVDGDVQNLGATVAPGEVPGPPSTGVIRITGSYAQAAAGTLATEISGTAQGITFDELDVTGPVTLAGTLAITTGASFTPQGSDTFQILKGPRTGEFTTLTGTQTGSLTYVAQYHAGDVTLVFGTPPPATTGGTPPPVPTPPGPAAPAPAPAPAAATPPAVVKVSADSLIKLPSTRACVSRRAFRIRLSVPHGVQISRAVVAVNGKSVKVLTGARLTAPVDLRGLPKGRFSVKVTVFRKSGAPLSSTRRYRTCVAKR